MAQVKSLSKAEFLGFLKNAQVSKGRREVPFLAKTNSQSSSKLTQKTGTNSQVDLSSKGIFSILGGINKIYL